MDATAVEGSVDASSWVRRVAPCASTFRHVARCGEHLGALGIASGLRWKPHVCAAAPSTQSLPTRPLTVCS